MDPSHGRAKAGRSARTYIQQLRADIGCSLEERWGLETGGERGSGRSVQAARHDDAAAADDDDDDDDINQ